MYEYIHVNLLYTPASFCYWGTSSNRTTQNLKVTRHLCVFVCVCVWELLRHHSTSSRGTHPPHQHTSRRYSSCTPRRGALPIFARAHLHGLLHGQSRVHIRRPALLFHVPVTNVNVSGKTSHSLSACCLTSRTVGRSWPMKPSVPRGRWLPLSCASSRRSARWTINIERCTSSDPEDTWLIIPEHSNPTSITSKR